MDHFTFCSGRGSEKSGVIISYFPGESREVLDAWRDVGAPRRSSLLVPSGGEPAKYRGNLLLPYFI